MKISENLKSVLDVCETDYMPQNPSTIDNPDVVHYGAEATWGIFILRKKDVSNPNFALRRLVFSKMVYGDNMRTLLLIDEEYAVPNFFIACFQKFFDYVIVIKDDDYKDVGDLLRRKNPIEVFSIPRKISEQCNINYYDLRNFYEKVQYNPADFGIFNIDKVEKVFVSSPFYEKRITTKLLESPSAVYFSRNAEGKSFLGSFENLVTSVMLNNFDFSGKRLRVRNWKHCFAITNMDFDNMRNGLDYLNTLFFMGILPVSVNNCETLNGLGEVWI